MKRRLSPILTLLVMLFSLSSIFAQFNPQPNWKDSYNVDGLCFCTTNGTGSYDHGIANKTVNINGRAYTVRQICEELKRHPQYRAFRAGDIPYNTIQCGNTPYNDAPDEPGCPGRVDIGTSGCNIIGPKWDMAWLETRPIFQGNGNDNGGNNGGDNGGNDGNADEGEIGTAGNGGSGAGQGPRLRVITPTLNKRMTAPAKIIVKAEATDLDGVREIEVKINGRVVRLERVPPYLWNDRGQDAALSNLPAQNYLIEVKAVDNKGNSSIVDILVYVEGNTTGGGNNSGGVTIKGQSINKYASSEGGSRSMRANRTSVGSGERFTVASAGNGTVSFKGSNGKYISSENGGKAMNCNRNAVGSWEKFTLQSLGGDLYAIKGNNGKYVSHENGADKGMFCNRSAVGSWEKFVIKGLNNRSARTSLQTAEVVDTQKISVYPNPATAESLNLMINSQIDAKSSVEIIDLNGRSIFQKDLGILKAGASTINLDGVKNQLTKGGMYLVRIKVGEKITVKRMIFK